LSTSLPPSASRSRRAPDLTPSEQALADRFSALARAPLSEELRARCLADLSEVGLEPAPTSHPRWVPSLLTTFLAAAAALLLAFGVAALTSSSGDAGDGRGPSLAKGSFASLRVVDDPSVPLFHGLETFDQLAGSKGAMAFAGRAGR